MKKQFTFLILFFVLIFSSAIPFIANAAESPPFCTSYTYSDWSVCDPNLGNQLRENISNTPSDCIIDFSGNNPAPITRQSCTPECTSSSWSCGIWNACSSSGSQTRTCTGTANCQGGVPSPATTQSCTYTPPTCTSFTYSNWSNCSSIGNQARSVISSSPSSCAGGSPVVSQSCTPPPASYVCYPNCGARICVNDSCNQSGYMKAAVGDKISIVHSDLKLAKKITVGNTQIDSWNLKDDILEFFLPDNIKTGGVFVNVYHSDGNLIADGTLTIYSKSTLPPPPSCTADTWTCGTWSSCSISGIQNRSCTKTFDCPNVQTAPPTTDQYCEAPSRPAQQVPQEGSDVISNQDVIIRATVKLLCPVDAQKASQGSGTIIDSNGTILTNKHVIAGTLGCLVGFISDFNDEPYFGERQIADITKVSPNQDIAILKIRNPLNKALPSVDITKGSSNLRLGTKITTYGFPAKFGTKVTYTSGDFSGADGNYIKTTAILEYGNSGGGAYLKDGTFIGIPSAVVKGELNALGYILSINTINSWLGNSSITYGGTNNNYSRVSALEDIDLNKLDALKLFIPDTDTKGNLIAPATNQGAQKTTEQAQNNQTQKESTIIESADTNQKTNPEQNNSALSEKKPVEEKGGDSSISLPEQRRSVVANAVQEMVKVAERNGGVGQEIKTIAQTQTQSQEKLETGLQKIQSRGGFTRFFIGPNYGEIKESQKLLKQNKEQIQKLNQLRAQITGQKDQQQIAEQVQLLGQATQQIENTLNEAQKGFSILGWMFRLFAK